MKRRTFIQNSVLAAGSLFLQSYKNQKPQQYQLVIVRGGSPGGMLDLGLEILDHAGRFVQKGQTVLIKPSLSRDQGPEPGVNTNTDLLVNLVKYCYKSGAKGVYLFDQTKNSRDKRNKNSKMKQAVRDAGAKILPAGKKSLYQDVEIPVGNVMKTIKIHPAVRETDIIINVPAVKPDPHFGLFGAFQNLAELIRDNEKYACPTQERVIDFLYYRKPVLNIMDIYRVPPEGQSTEIKEYKTLILSPDIVSAEIFAAKRLGIDPRLLKYAELAAKAGFGQINPPMENIRSIVLKNSQTAN